ncbi:hypothetical protein [Methylomonas methanica]|uniref:Uncharacterized protein n=1 Tax=Methylomonas methanica TaxID=421 RepID=A0A177M5J5_METMH|nr:hypothetical protein [Methylomonas methanica]OAI00814.1 hypothetical protein A1332_18205 [Methylomonas methanica]
MATKKKSANKAASSPAVDKDTAKALAKVALRPSANAAAVVTEYTKMFGDHDINDLVDELVDSIEKVNAGDMKRCEGMLMGQAQALQSIFVNLSRRAINQEYLKNYEAFMRMALKAQSQCRQTLETLSNIKNPPVVYAKQANISNGPQQINNGVPAQTPHAEEIKNQSNELLEVIDGERLDSGTAQETIGSNTALATMG